MNARKDNFRRIAENRTNKILSMISLLGNLSNKSYYEYSIEEIDHIFDSIFNELEIQKMKFINKDKKKERFRL
jgi:hypothetical protein